jgi:zinc protease
VKKLSLVCLVALALCMCCAHSRVQREPRDRNVVPQRFTAARMVLPNGITVVAVENHKLPIFQAVLTVNVGALYDPEGKAGVANLTASLLDKGAAERTATQIADELDYTGGDLDVRCGRVTTQISVHVLTEHTPVAMGLVRDMLTAPRFPEEEVSRNKTRILSEIIRAKEEPFSVVSYAFQELVYEGSPLVRPVLGYEKTLEAVNREDVALFHRDYYLPNNSVLVMVADYTTEEMIHIAGEYLGSWERRDLQALPVPSPELVGRTRVRLVDMDINQSYIAFGNLGLRRSNPDYNAVRIMNYILGGGGFVSRITKSIRARQGLAYSAYSYFVPGPQYRGYFRAGLQTKIESTSQALNSLLEEIRRMRDEPVTPQELEDAKSFYQGSIPRQQESYGQIARLYGDREIYGLEDEYWIRDLEEIQSLGVEDIRRVAGEYLTPENYVVTIVTKVDSLKLDLEDVTEEMIERTVP